MYKMKNLNDIGVGILFSMITFCKSTSSFWTNPFGAVSSNQVPNTGSGSTTCPKWATYFEVANTTIDCKTPKLNLDVPFRLQGDTFCEKICDEVSWIYERSV